MGSGQWPCGVHGMISNMDLAAQSQSSQNKLVVAWCSHYCSHCSVTCQCETRWGNVGFRLWTIDASISDPCMTFRERTHTAVTLLRDMGVNIMDSSEPSSFINSELGFFYSVKSLEYERGLPLAISGPKIENNCFAFRF